MQANDRRPTRLVIDGHHVESHRAVPDVALGQETFRRSHGHLLLFLGHAELRQRGQVITNCSRSHFDECQRMAIISDEIELALCADR